MRLQKSSALVSIVLASFGLFWPTGQPARGAEIATTRHPVRGIVRPVAQAAIATDLGVRIAEIRFREAQSFKKGDVLVRLDCERLEAEHAAAAAVAREAKLALESNSYLDKRGAAGRFDVEVSRARVDKAESEARALQARLRQCLVVAPFDGRVTELVVNEHEIPAPGKPFIGIVDETRFEIDLIVPSQWLRTLAPGAGFRFAVDETGRVHEAKVLRMGAVVDPVSQTVKVIAGFASSSDGVLAGMSGTAAFDSLETRP